MIPGGAHALMLGGDPCEQYQIGNSVRFNAADTPYLSRTPVTGNGLKWTFSFWVKRSTLGIDQALLGVYNNSNNGSLVLFASDNTLGYTSNYGGVVRGVKTIALHRDTAAHQHVVIAFDASLAAEADRCIVLINGARANVAAVGSGFPALNQASYINLAGQLHTLSTYATSMFFGGYLSEIHFVDGQALDASAFGFFCPSTGQWRPKAYAGTYGTNGFRLDFSDGSAATAAALGADRSGNENNWTPTNISVTPGAGNDWLEDTTSHNFCTMNPLDVAGITVAALSNGNLDVAIPNSDVSIRGSHLLHSGKWYFELDATNVSGIYNTIVNVGIAAPDATFSSALAWLLIVHNGNKVNAGSSTAYGSGPGSGPLPTIGVAFDLDNGKIWWRDNTGWFASGDPAAGLNAAFSGVAGPVIPFVSGGGGGYSGTAFLNFGQRAFAYTAPTGFKALCTKNLPVPAIKMPVQHMTVKLAPGANIKATAEAVYPSFLEWIKDRANANNHQLVDSVRGLAAVLQSNTTAAEAAYAAPAGSSVAWLWRAGGAAMMNNAGSIASQVSVNAAAGLSIVSYTGTGANASVGHGLGVAPKLIIIKDRANGNWAILHGELANTEYMLLNSQNAKATSAAYWNSTSPTSTVFSLGTAVDVNAVGHNYIAYCFSEVIGFSRFGKYAGNGVAEGPFVHCGFRPAFAMVKRIDTSLQSWSVIDAARDPYNSMADLLQMNSNAQESSAVLAIDIVSNGFKIRNTDLTWNASGGVYIFAAFAEFPFKYANAR